MNILLNILIIFSISIAVIYVCNRLKIPAIIGLLITGIVVGPYGLQIIKSTTDVELLAEIGIITLLFTIGLELSFDEIASLKRAIAVGVLQVSITILIVTGIMLVWTSFSQAIFFGFIVSLSSTAVVLKVIQELALSESPHGRISLAILIVQDIAIVPLMLFIPLLAGVSKNSIPIEMFKLIVKGALIVVVVIVLARYVVPRLLFEIAKTRSRELFVITIVTICLGVTLATYSMGMSVELGAFLAGIIIAASEYSGQTFSSMMPFRDLFTSFFFISIGMLLNPVIVVFNIVTIANFSVLILSIKIIIIATIVLAVGYPLRIAFLTGFALPQIGEFSFILAQIGMSYALLSQEEYQLFLSITIFAMGITPYLIKYSPALVDMLLQLPFPEKLQKGFSYSDDAKVHTLQDHIIIVGYGINGRNVAAAAKSIKIPYIIVEMNPETVKKEKKEGENIIYGDASQEDLLHYLNISSARVLVIAIADRSAIKRIVVLARRINPHIHIIVRARFVGDMKELIELGANEVIPEEYETSIEIFARVLHYYGVPRSDIEAMIESIRAKGYAMLRKLHVDVYKDLPIAEIDMQAIRVCSNSTVAGKTIGQMQFRKVHKFSVVALKRNDTIITNPGADDKIESDDILYVVGKREDISKAVQDLRLSDNATSCEL
ncbi:MAG: cation:proton antiporter [Spirochaetota bacterium]|nr:cation:proton antiporter [Spirochaetota bacterium]